MARTKTGTKTLPEYATCEHCDEYASAALVMCADGVVRCRNCCDSRHPLAMCRACGRMLPCQEHHVASRARYPRLVLLLCLNCHAIITRWQDDWRRSGEAEASPTPYLLRGMADLVRMWRRRSPDRKDRRAHLLVDAAMADFERRVRLDLLAGSGFALD